MSTSTRPPLTRPRKAQLILESTTAMVAGTLLLWLLLWFMKQGPRQQDIMALGIKPRSQGNSAFHIENDVKTLSNSKSAGITGIDLESLGSEVESRIRAKPSSVVYLCGLLTDPEGLDASTDKIVNIISDVAQNAQRDILIVLDFSQVDSDRGLSLFGYAPYLALKKKLGELKPHPKYKVVVLCSSEPGQKSWMSDGLGRSIFSYWLQRGLAGEANPDSDKKSITVERLFQFVRSNTFQWVDVYRGGARQTPVLLAVGSELLPKLSEFNLPRFAFNNASETDSASLAKGESPPASKTLTEAPPEKLAPKKSKKEELKIALLEEWKAHEDLSRTLDSKVLRYAPAQWKIYEATLLQAERLLRACWNDPFLEGPAKDGIAEATRIRDKSLKTTLEAAKDQDKDFPFHSVGGEGEDNGKKDLDDALISLTKVNLAGLAPEDPADPAKKANGKAASPFQKTPGVEYPSRHLDLQLPLWAYRFEQAFHVKPFSDERWRGELLREGVQGRLAAESALDFDRRGIRWIEVSIVEGDKIRRRFQDELFAVPYQSSTVDDLTNQVGRYKAIYDVAKERIKEFHEGRILFERIAADLPYYAEWALLDEIRQKNSDASNLVQLVLKNTRSLDEAISQPDQYDDLVKIRKKTSADFEKLKGSFDARVARLTKDGDWRELDELLAVPLIAPPVRERLLQSILERETTPPIASAKADSPPNSPLAEDDFLEKAKRLAWLDLELRKIGNGGKDRFPVISTTLTGVVGSKPTESSETRELERRRMLESFKDISKGLHPPTNLSPNESAGIDEKSAREIDRDVRFRSAEELTGSKDQAATQLENFGRWATLRFHTERLALDSVGNGEKLTKQLEKMNFTEDLLPVRFSPVGFDLSVIPPLIRIDEKDLKAEFQVGVSRSQQAKASQPLDGKAFLGVFQPVDATTVSADPAAKKPEVQLVITPLTSSSAPMGLGLAGSLVDLKTDPQPPFRFQVEQTSDAGSEENPRKLLMAKVYYRGHIYESAKEIPVECLKFGPPLFVDISQDVEATKARCKYDGLIKDQFELHPGYGYLHNKEQLDYVLTIRNARNEPRDIVVERFLQSKEEEPLKPEKKHINPKGQCEIKGQITASEVPIGSPKVLIVRVKDVNGKPLIEERRFPIRQLELTEYVDFKPTPGPQMLEIEVQRKLDDKVTDPIFYREIKAEVDGEGAAPQENFRDDRIFWPGVSIKVSQSYDRRSKGQEIKWKVFIKQAGFSGTSRVP